MGIFDRLFREKREKRYSKIMEQVLENNLRAIENEHLRIKAEDLRDKENYLRGYNAAMAKSRPVLDEQMEELEVVE